MSSISDQQVRDKIRQEISTEKRTDGYKCFLEDIEKDKQYVGRFSEYGCKCCKNKPHNCSCSDFADMHYYPSIPSSYALPSLLFRLASRYTPPQSFRTANYIAPTNSSNESYFYHKTGILLEQSTQSVIVGFVVYFRNIYKVELNLNTAIFKVLSHEPLCRSAIYEPIACGELNTKQMDPLVFMLLAKCYPEIRTTIPNIWNKISAVNKNILHSIYFKDQINCICCDKAFGHNCYCENRLKTVFMWPTIILMYIFNKELFETIDSDESSDESSENSEDPSLCYMMILPWGNCKIKSDCSNVVINDTELTIMGRIFRIHLCDQFKNF